MIGWIGLILNNITVLSALSNISNLKKIFNKTWSHMKFKNRLVSKKISLRCLNRACGVKIWMNCPLKLQMYTLEKSSD